MAINSNLLRVLGKGWWTWNQLKAVNTLSIRVSQPAHDQSIAMQNWKMGNNTNSRCITHTLPSWWDAPRRTVNLHVSGSHGNMRKGSVLTEYFCTSKRCRTGMAVRILTEILYQISDALWIHATSWGGRQRAAHTVFSLWKILAHKRLECFVAKG